MLNRGDNSSSLPYGKINACVADELAARLPIFACDPSTKRPLTAHGFYDAAHHASHWRTSPTALVGVPTADFWVLDLDNRPDWPIEQVIRRLLRLLGLTWRELVLRCEILVKTPSDGIHLYFRRTSGLAVGTRAGDIGPGIDTRGHDSVGKPSGYVIAPGCVLGDGRRYEIIRGSIDTLTESLAPAPLGLLKLAAFSKSERAHIVERPDLQSALGSVPPDQWQSIVAAQYKAERLAQPVVKLDAMGMGWMRRQAFHDLQTKASGLASLNDGRRYAVYDAARQLGKYATNKVLSAAEVEGALLGAWVACGAAKDYGNEYARGAIRRGLDKARNDPLPPLARRFRESSGLIR